MADESLAWYQEALLNLLARQDIGDDERLRLLREQEAFAPFAGYVDGIEPCFVALGVELMRKWGRREDE